MLVALFWFIVISVLLDFIFDRKYYSDHEGFRTELIKKIKEMKR